MLAWILLGFALALAPFVFIAVQSSRAYPRLFGDTHLHEVAATLARLKAEARGGSACSAITSEGLALTWDATRPEIRVSQRRGRLPPPAAAFFLAFIDRLAAPPAGTDRLQRRDAGRFVLSWRLPPDAAAAFRERPLDVPAADALPALRAAAADAMRGHPPRPGGRGGVA